MDRKRNLAGFTNIRNTGCFPFVRRFGLLTLLLSQSIRVLIDNESRWRIVWSFARSGNYTVMSTADHKYSDTQWPVAACVECRWLGEYLDNGYSNKSSGWTIVHDGWLFSTDATEIQIRRNFSTVCLATLFFLSSKHSWNSKHRGH